MERLIAAALARSTIEAMIAPLITVNGNDVTGWFADDKIALVQGPQNFYNSGAFDDDAGMARA